MLRDLSAIGLSRFTGQQAAAELAGDVLRSGRFKGLPFPRDQHRWVELHYDMGPFAIYMRGRQTSPRFTKLYTLMPALKEKRGYLFQNWEIRPEEDHVYFTGQEAQSLEIYCLELTDTARVYREPVWLQEPFLRSSSMNVTPVSCYGMSTEGEILLPSYRTAQDQGEIEKRISDRHDLMERASSGDSSAFAQIDAQEALQSEEVAKRLKTEDVFTVFDGFIFPDDREPNGYIVLGDIVSFEKLFNPYSEEWVYYLDLSVLGHLLRVLINPSDLTGQPAPGRRFQGLIRLYGRLDPAQVMLEDMDSFY